MMNDENPKKALAPKAQAFAFSFPMQAPVTMPSGVGTRLLAPSHSLSRFSRRGC